MEKGTLAATSGKKVPDPESAELARLRAENRKLKAESEASQARAERLESDLGKTRAALDLAGKAFALLEQISGSADTPKKSNGSSTDR